MQVKLVVFDISGTTVKDTDQAVSKAFHSALFHFGYDVPFEKIYPLMGYKKSLAIEQMLQAYEPDHEKITVSLIDAIHELFVAEMISHYKNHPDIEPLPNVEDVFTTLHSYGIKIGVNTGFPLIIAETVMERLGWQHRGLIDLLIGSDEVEQGRPFPYMIERLMEQCGISNPHEVIKIGDTEVDIREGQNAGCLYSIGITTGAFTRQELEAYQPDFIIDDMRELITIINRYESR